MSFSSAIKRIYQSQIVLFTTKTLKAVIAAKKESTFFKYLNRLVNEGFLTKVVRGKYLLKDAQVSDFELANFIYSPSYISFETALNFWGILPQFPYEITSATVKKTLTKNFQSKVFSYSHLNKSLFWGFIKNENFLIASKEKALLDQVYFYSKGIKTINWQELNYQPINRSLLKNFLKNYPKTKQFLKAIETLKIKMGQKLWSPKTNYPP